VRCPGAGFLLLLVTVRLDVLRVVRGPGQAGKGHHGRHRRRPGGRWERFVAVFRSLGGGWSRGALLLLWQSWRRPAKERDSGHARQSHAAWHLGHSSPQFLLAADLGVDIIVLLLFLLVVFFFNLFLLCSGGSMSGALIAVFLLGKVLLALGGVSGAGQVRLIAITWLEAPGRFSPGWMRHPWGVSLIRRPPDESVFGVFALERSRHSRLPLLCELLAVEAFLRGPLWLFLLG
jgi:hypothetical protein